jgi:hypothetical protein
MSAVNVLTELKRFADFSLKSRKYKSPTPLSSGLGEGSKGNGCESEN